LAEQSSAMAGALDHETALRRLSGFLVRHLADYCITYSLEPDGALRRVGVCHRQPNKGWLVERLSSIRSPSLDDAVGLGAAVRSGRAVLCAQADEALIDSA